MAKEERTEKKMSTEHKNLNLRLALQMAAPHTWPAAIGPCLVAGGLVIWRTETVNLPMWCVLLLICIFMQSAANIFNDYYDLLRGTDQTTDYVEKNDAVLVYNDIPPRQAFFLGTGVLATTLLLAIYPVAAGGLSVLGIGIAGAVILVCYSAGPFPLSSIPVGELLAGFTMGSLIPLACVNALTGTADGIILIDSLPLMLGIGLMMMTNNICDVERDLRVNRKTLAVLLGRPRARLLYRIMLFVWTTLLAGYMLFRFPLTSSVHWPWLIPCIAAGIAGIKSLIDQLKLDLNPPCRPFAMKGIARLNALFSLIYFFWLLVG